MRLVIRSTTYSVPSAASGQVARVLELSGSLPAAAEQRFGGQGFGFAFEGIGQQGFGGGRGAIIPQAF